MPFEIVRNDIVKMEVDAIVNTANPKPVVGTGVDTAIHKAAGCIGGAVGTITAYAENCDIGHTCNPLGCRQRKLLIASAFSVAGQPDNRLATGNKGKLSPLPRIFTGDLRQPQACILCLTV